MRKASTDKHQLMRKISTDKHQLMRKASTDKHQFMDKASMDKDMSMDMLNKSYSLTTTGQGEDKLTENQMCRVEQTWQQSKNLLTLVGSLKIEACLIWKPF